MALTRVNPNTIQDKVLVGYQGWFTCAGDGDPIAQGHHGWLHWFNTPIPNGGRPNVDFWPDVSEYDPSELHPAPGLTTASGDPLHLFSSRNPKTVHRHFHWMALHGIDGAFLQRFATQCEIKPGNLGLRDLRDEIGDRVQEAADAEGRVFAIMYDVSGVPSDKIQSILEQDWAHLINEKHILDSPNYLREKGRPVVALWGFGFNGRNHTPELVRAIAGFFRAFTPGGVYLLAGTPGHWRTSTSDADRNPEFVRVWTDCFDAISPWTVGRFGNEEEADQWGQGRLKEDADYLNRLAANGGPKVDYIPVILPGGSGFNLSEGKWRMNDMRRNGGQFLWRQLYNARRAGVRTIYGAMWDEYDEGTAYMPIVPYASQLPVHSSFRFLALDVDGHDLPSDWYMRILGYAAEAFHGERTLLDTFPIKELQDYWSTRPRHTRNKIDERPADIEGVTRAFRDWDVSGKSHPAITDAPPPYSLEDAPPRQGPARQTLADDGVSRPPPVRQDTRPSSGHPHSLLTGAAAVAAPLAAGLAARTFSAGSTASSQAAPPPVRPTTRPPPMQTSYSAPAGPPSVTTHAPYSAPAGPPTTTTRPPYTAPLGPPPPMHSSYPVPPGPPPVRHASHDIGVDHHGVYSPPPGLPPFEHGRSRGRSRSRSRSRSHSRKGKHKHKGGRSRSRSSSGSRKGRGHGPPMQSVHQSLLGHGHGDGHGHSSSPDPHLHRHPSYGAHEHGHGHRHQHHYTHSLSPGGSPHGMGFPGPGEYTPIHSHPVGYPHGQQEYAQGGYAGSYAPPNAPPNEPQGGYGYGQGYGRQGYDAMGRVQQPGYGYAPHPSSSGYPSYGAPYPGGPPVGRGGGGAVQGGFASALRAVESVAGSQARDQVEKRVGSLLNRFK